MSLIEDLRRLPRVQPADRRFLAEALVMLTAASIAIRLFPFRRVARLASRALPPSTPLEEERARIVSKARWAVTLWAERTPWRTVCFQTGLAVHWMLRRRGIPSLLHYGVGFGDDRALRAHVWVSEGGQDVVGGSVKNEYKCLAVFPQPGA